MSLKPLFLFACTLCALPLMAQKNYTLTSPDGTLQATVATGSDLRISLSADGETLLAPSPVSMTLGGGEVLGSNPKVTRARKNTADARIASPFYKKSSVRDHYNELELTMRGDYGLVVRLYDDGLAYRFTTRKKDGILVENEQVAYTFPGDYTAYAPYVGHKRLLDFEGQFRNSFENTYTTARLSALDPGRLMFLPLAVDAGDGVKVCITETDLENYPGLYLTNAGAAKNGLKGVFAPCPEKLEQGGHNNLQMLVRERKDHIAEINAPRTFPWRVAIVGTDTDLAASDLSFLLAAPSKIDDTSWIKPGKVAWEWWNASNLYDVDFKAGINNETYKYYIWFASQHGIEYVILDEGWAVNKQADLMQVVPEIDLEELVEYGRERNVGIILWAGYYAFERDMERVVKHYADMGVKGFKVDFMDRDDQQMTAFNYRAAATAARYGLILDLHGTHKPAGLNRTWPNVLNFEGVHGLEQMKWSPESVDQMKYDVTIPFIRQAAGPMDYTQGAMRNATRNNYRPVNSEPMSQGTRCHQLALYVVLDSPLNMLCDSPTAYLHEKECTEFIAAIPTVWDETRILGGRLGEYIVTARRKGSTWYVGGITDWTPRDVEIDLAPLGIDATVEATIFRDGANADRKASDYRRASIRIDTSKPLTVHLAPGGGFVVKIED